MSPGSGDPAGGSPLEGGRTVDAGRGWAWITEGFALFKKQPGMWIGIVLVLFVIMVVLSIIPVLGAIATFLLMPVFGGGMMLGCQSVERDGTLEMGHLFAGFKMQTGNLVALGGLAVVGWIIVVLPVIAIVGTGAFFGAARGDAAGIGAIGGSFLLAVLVALALSILVYMALWFAPALVTLRGVAPVAALKQSFKGCLSNIVPFLVYGLVVFVLSILATIPLALGWLVLGPVLVASVYVAYRDIYGDA
ncbi:MAG: hypothetical protein A3I02_02995 [Betaproteobacteria bacterium RIFCSPLOWO2_02_FULL_67_26]|nr:MAG: hypothetical protein A3I02_02995 [Betaproteobacteria bacterium RIFCSPLOWO2_02_FULL_67_26]